MYSDKKPRDWRRKGKQMKLSTRGRYGIHAMYDLAAHGGDGPVPIKAISEREHVPEAYLEQLMAVLKRAGLVNSTRGAQGGYTLSREASQISVGEILRALEGGLNLVDCLTEEDACGKSCECPSRVVYQKLRDGLNALADSITLQDMMNDYSAKAQEE